MKKFIFIFAALFLGLSQVSAQEIYVENFTAPEDGVQKFDVKYRGIKGRTIQGYIFKFEFPGGLSLATDDKGKVIYELPTENEDFDVKTTATGVQASPSSKSSKLAGDEGVLVTLTLQVNDPLVEGSTANVKVYGASLTEKVVNEDETSSYKDLDTNPFTFDVTIVDKYTTLSENETEAPAAMNNANIRVERTIKAKVWNTICLPFAMTETQVKDAFGTDVKLADFVGCESDGTRTKTATYIKVKFESASAIEANHPYLIKVSNTVSEFTADDVNVNPVATPAVKKDEVQYEYVNPDGDIVPGQAYNSFIGTYIAPTSVPKQRLYIKDNNFYYSKGNSTIKAFRGFFFFQNCKLDDATASSAKFGFVVDDEEVTGIDGISLNNHIVEGVYDLSGRKIEIDGNNLNKLQKGVYIIDGKKVTIK